MVRLIIPSGTSHSLDLGDGPILLEGPQEIILEKASIAGQFQSSGEFVYTGIAWQQTLPYLREELAIALPVSLVMALLIALTWMRRI